MERTNFKGLTTSEAEERLRRFGKNVLPQEKRFRAISIFFSQLPTFINLILLAAGVLSFLIGDNTDAILIFSILVLNAIFGFIQEYKAERAIARSVFSSNSATSRFLSCPRRSSPFSLYSCFSSAVRVRECKVRLT